MKTWMKWTPEESASLIAWGVTEHGKRGFVPPIAEAMAACLPPERRKKPYPTLESKYRTDVAVALSERRNKVKDERAKHEAEEEERRKREVEEREAAVEQERAALQAAAATLFKLAIRDPSVQDALRALVHTSDAPVAGAADAEEVGRKRVLIVGPIGAQVQAISETHGRGRDLRFWSTDDSYERLKSLAATSDATVVMTGFLSHSMTEMAREVSGDRYYPTPGGVSGVRSVLETLEQRGVI